MTDNKLQAKFKNKMSYHLSICFIAENATRFLFQVNQATDVFFMILRDVINLSFY